MSSSIFQTKPFLSAPASRAGTRDKASLLQAECGPAQKFRWDFMFLYKGKTQIRLVLASSADFSGTELTAFVSFAQELGLARELLEQTPQVHHGNLHPPAKKPQLNKQPSPSLPSPSRNQPKGKRTSLRITGCNAFRQD